MLFRSHRVIAGIVAAAGLADDEARRPKDVLRGERIADRLSAGGAERECAEGSGGQGRCCLARAGGSCSPNPWAGSITPAAPVQQLPATSSIDYTKRLHRPSGRGLCWGVAKR